MMGNKKIVLAYSGGLDTSVAVKWLTDKGFDVIGVEFYSNGSERRSCTGRPV